MNCVTTLAMLILTAIPVALAGEIAVYKLEGEVSVRRGVTEAWTTLAAGDVLRPNDSIRTGKNGSASLVVPAFSTDVGPKRITLPSEVIVDISDIRNLTQEELILKLTMEKVRGSSYQWKNDELRLPNAAVVHGQNNAPEEKAEDGDTGTGQYLLNGAKVLCDNGFYATAVLRSMEVFRLFPALASAPENRLQLAFAMEKANLRGEALHEYGALLGVENLTVNQRSLVQSRMQELRK